MFWALTAACALFFLLVGCAARNPASAETAAEPALKEETALYAVKVGKGDAILFRAGGKNYLIDAGKAIRWGRVYSALKALGITRLDGVFLTHTDKDHAGGLMPLALSDIEVGTWYASGYFCEPKKEKNHPALKAAAVRGQEVTFLKAGDTAEGVFTVLAPFELDEADEDDNSLVMRAEVNGFTVLLTGDMERGEEKQLLKSSADLSCEVLKVPNHGDNDACSAKFLARTGAKIAVISTDPVEKPNTPDELVLEDIEAAGATVYRTDLCEGVIRIGYREGKTEVSEFPLPAATDLKDITVRIEADKTELITLTNTGKASADLTGSYFITLKKEEAFLFPAGTVLEPGESLTVGTLSTPLETDLVWEEKNVFSEKKEDGVTFFDAAAEPVLAYWIGED